MHLLSLVLLSCSFMQFLSAAHPSYNSIKFVLMKVGEGKISLDTALDGIVGSDLKKKIICDTYEEDFKDFFYSNKEHLDLFYTKLGCTEYKAHPDNASFAAYNMVQLHSADPHLYTQLTEVLFSNNPAAKKISKPPLFMYRNGSTKQDFFGYGDKSLFFYAHADKILHAKVVERAEETGIRAYAAYNNSGCLIIGHKNIYIQPNAEVDACRIIKLPDDFPIITALTHTDMPHLFVGITIDDSAWCVIRVKEQELTWKCIGTAKPGIVAIGSEGCRVYLHRAEGDGVVVPYVLEDNEKLRNFDFSIASASLLYRMIQDLKHGTVTVTSEERATIKELIPDMYQKTLQVQKSLT